MNRILGATALVLALAIGGAACSAFRDDRQYVSPERYRQAQLLYKEVGSLKLVKEMLKDAGWLDSEIRQVEYQMLNEEHLDTPDEPRPLK